MSSFRIVDFDESNVEFISQKLQERSTKYLDHPSV